MSGPTIPTNGLFLSTVKFKLKEIRKTHLGNTFNTKSLIVIKLQNLQISQLAKKLSPKNVLKSSNSIFELNYLKTKNVK